MVVSGDIFPTWTDACMCWQHPRGYEAQVWTWTPTCHQTAANDLSLIHGDVSQRLLPVPKVSSKGHHVPDILDDNRRSPAINRTLLLLLQSTAPRERNRDQMREPERKRHWEDRERREMKNSCMRTCLECCWREELSHTSREY